MAFYNDDVSSIEDFIGGKLLLDIVKSQITRKISAATSATILATTYTFNRNSSISSNDEGEQRLFDDYSQGLLSFASAMCIIFIVLGVPGNLITIIALTRCKKVSSISYVLLSSGKLPFYTNLINLPVGLIGRSCPWISWCPFFCI